MSKEVWEGVTIIRKCEGPKEVSQWGGVMVMGRGKRT